MRIYIFLLLVTITFFTKTLAADWCNHGCEEGYENVVCNRGEACPASEGCMGVQDFTDDVREMLLDEHNRYRSKVALGEEKGIPVNIRKAANMMALSWDNELELAARCHAMQCSFSQDLWCRKTPKYDGFGQLVAALEWPNGDCNSFHFAKQAVNHWMHDNKNLTLDEDHLNEDLSDYYQLIWAKTTHVGCFISQKSIKNGKNSCIIACNYASNNIIKDDTIYSQGNPCSECPEGELCHPQYHGLCGISYGLNGNIANIPITGKYNATTQTQSEEKGYFTEKYASTKLYKSLYKTTRSDKAQHFLDFWEKKILKDLETFKKEEKDSSDNDMHYLVFGKDGNFKFFSEKEEIDPVDLKNIYWEPIKKEIERHMTRDVLYDDLKTISKGLEIFDTTQKPVKKRLKIELEGPDHSGDTDHQDSETEEENQRYDSYYDDQDKKSDDNVHNDDTGDDSHNNNKDFKSNDKNDENTNNDATDYDKEQEDYENPYNDYDYKNDEEKSIDKKKHIRVKRNHKIIKTQKKLIKGKSNYIKKLKNKHRYARNTEFDNSSDLHKNKFLSIRKHKKSIEQVPKSFWRRNSRGNAFFRKLKKVEKMRIMNSSRQVKINKKGFLRQSQKSILHPLNQRKTSFETDNINFESKVPEYAVNNLPILLQTFDSKNETENNKTMPTKVQEENFDFGHVKVLFASGEIPHRNIKEHHQYQRRKFGSHLEDDMPVKTHNKVKEKNTGRSVYKNMLNFLLAEKKSATKTQKKLLVNLVKEINKRYNLDLKILNKTEFETLIFNKPKKFKSSNRNKVQESNEISRKSSNFAMNATSSSEIFFTKKSFQPFTASNYLNTNQTIIPDKNISILFQDLKNLSNKGRLDSVIHNLKQESLDLSLTQNENQNKSHNQTQNVYNTKNEIIKITDANIYLNDTTIFTEAKPEELTEFKSVSKITSFSNKQESITNSVRNTESLQNSSLQIIDNSTTSSQFTWEFNFYQGNSTENVLGNATGVAIFSDYSTNSEIIIAEAQNDSFVDQHISKHSYANASSEERNKMVRNESSEKQDEFTNLTQNNTLFMKKVSLQTQNKSTQTTKNRNASLDKTESIAISTNVLLAANSESTENALHEEQEAAGTLKRIWRDLRYFI